MDSDRGSTQSIWVIKYLIISPPILLGGFFSYSDWKPKSFPCPVKSQHNQPVFSMTSSPAAPLSAHPLASCLFLRRRHARRPPISRPLQLLLPCLDSGPLDILMGDLSLPSGLYSKTTLHETVLELPPEHFNSSSPLIVYGPLSCLVFPLSTNSFLIIQ